VHVHMLGGESALGSLRVLQRAGSGRFASVFKSVPSCKCRSSGILDQSLRRGGVRALLGGASVVQRGDAQRLLEEPVALKSPDGMKVGLALCLQAKVAGVIRP
jgi:hypothetical protein